MSVELLQSSYQIVQTTRLASWRSILSLLAVGDPPARD